MDSTKADKIKEIAKSHAAYWNSINPDSYKGGPFSDKSGGLITFKSNSYIDAKKLIDNDPFNLNHVFDKKWFKEWEIIEL
jgi:uncharacterized protein YciI